MAETEMIELTFILLGETELAWIVKEDEKSEREPPLALPKSKCERGKKLGEVQLPRKGFCSFYEFEVPEWLAKKEGLI